MTKCGSCGKGARVIKEMCDRCEVKKFQCVKKKCKSVFCDSCHPRKYVDKKLAAEFSGPKIGFILQNFNNATGFIQCLQGMKDISPNNSLATSLVISVICFLISIQDQGYDKLPLKSKDKKKKWNDYFQHIVVTDLKEGARERFKELKSVSFNCDGKKCIFPTFGIA